MEVSSHALAQQRVFGIPFDVAVFTNLTRDHLDYHKSMDEYFEAKRALFEGCGTDPPRAAVTNPDDEYGAKSGRVQPEAERSTADLWMDSSGDFHAEKVDIAPRGTRFDLVTPEGKYRDLFSADRQGQCLQHSGRGRGVLCAWVQAQAIAEAESRVLTHVPGRFQRVDCGQPFTVVVDYAHTDDALRNLTLLARDL